MKLRYFIFSLLLLSCNVNAQRTIRADAIKTKSLKVDNLYVENIISIKDVLYGILDEYDRMLIDTIKVSKNIYLIRKKKFKIKKFKLWLNPHIYEDKKMLPEEIHITFKTEREAIRVQKRLTKWCKRPTRKDNILYLDKELIQCNRRVFGNNYGFIREKYRNQIDKQLK